MEEGVNTPIKEFGLVREPRGVHRTWGYGVMIWRNPTDRWALRNADSLAVVWCRRDQCRAFGPLSV